MADQNIAALITSIQNILNNKTAYTQLPTQITSASFDPTSSTNVLIYVNFLQNSLTSLQNAVTSTDYLNAINGYNNIFLTAYTGLSVLIPLTYDNVLLNINLKTINTDLPSLKYIYLEIFNYATADANAITATSIPTSTSNTLGATSLTNLANYQTQLQNDYNSLALYQNFSLNPIFSSSNLTTYPANSNLLSALTKLNTSLTGLLNIPFNPTNYQSIVNNINSNNIIFNAQYLLSIYTDQSTNPTKYGIINTSTNASNITTTQDIINVLNTLLTLGTQSTSAATSNVTPGKVPTLPTKSSSTTPCATNNSTKNTSTGSKNSPTPNVAQQWGVKFTINTPTPTVNTNNKSTATNSTTSPVNATNTNQSINSANSLLSGITNTLTTVSNNINNTSSTNTKNSSSNPVANCNNTNNTNASVYYMSLLPAMNSTIPMQGGRDVPNAMPGLNFKVVPSVAKHKIPGFQPTFQNLGMNQMVVTMVGCFTGADGAVDQSKAVNTGGTRGDTTDNISLFPGSFTAVGQTQQTTTPILSTIDAAIAQLNSYNSFQEFYNFAIRQGKQINVEINLLKTYKTLAAYSKYGDTKLQSSNGNPTFKAVVRNIEVYSRGSDRTWYTLQLEVVDFGLASKTPINLNNVLDKQIAAAQAAQAKANNAALNGASPSEQGAANLVNSLLPNIYQRIQNIDDPIAFKQQNQLYLYLVSYLQNIQNQGNYALNLYNNYQGSNTISDFITSQTSVSDIQSSPVTYNASKSILLRGRLNCGKVPIFGTTLTCDSEKYFLLNGDLNDDQIITKFQGNGKAENGGLSFSPSLSILGVFGFGNSSDQIALTNLAISGKDLGDLPQLDGSQDTLNSLTAQVSYISPSDWAYLIAAVAGCTASIAAGAVITTGSVGTAIGVAGALAAIGCAGVGVIGGLNAKDDINQKDSSWNAINAGHLVTTFLINFAVPTAFTAAGKYIAAPILNTISKAVGQNISQATNAPISNSISTLLNGLSNSQAEAALVGQNITAISQGGLQTSGVVTSIISNTANSAEPYLIELTNAAGQTVQVGISEVTTIPSNLNLPNSISTPQSSNPSSSTITGNSTSTLVSKLQALPDLNVLIGKEITAPNVGTAPVISTGVDGSGTPFVIVQSGSGGNLFVEVPLTDITSVPNEVFNTGGTTISPQPTVNTPAPSTPPVVTSAYSAGENILITTNDQATNIINQVKQDIGMNSLGDSGLEINTISSGNHTVEVLGEVDSTDNSISFIEKGTGQLVKVQIADIDSINYPDISKVNTSLNTPVITNVVQPDPIPVAQASTLFNNSNVIPENIMPPEVATIVQTLPKETQNIAASLINVIQENNLNSVAVNLKNGVSITDIPNATFEDFTEYGEGVVLSTTVDGVTKFTSLTDIESITPISPSQLVLPNPPTVTQSLMIYDLPENVINNNVLQLASESTFPSNNLDILTTLGNIIENNQVANIEIGLGSNNAYTLKNLNSLRIYSQTNSLTGLDEIIVQAQKGNASIPILLDDINSINIINSPTPQPIINPITNSLPSSISRK